MPGTAVFAGMLGVTFFGIFLTPVFYYVIQWAQRLTRFQRPQTNPEQVAYSPRACGGEPATPARRTFEPACLTRATSGYSESESCRFFRARQSWALDRGPARPGRI